MLFFLQLYITYTVSSERLLNLCTPLYLHGVQCFFPRSLGIGIPVTIFSCGLFYHFSLISGYASILDNDAVGLNFPKPDIVFKSNKFMALHLF